jgi:hypothetical protein
MRKIALPPLAHLRLLTDDTGVVQFANWSVPDPHYGYTLDDNVRALLVVLGYHHSGAERDAAAALAARYLAFIRWAQLPDGRFHNELSYDRRWLDDVGSEDALGRTVWALAVAAALPITDSLAGAAAELLARALPHVPGLRSLRARGYALIGLAHLVRAGHPYGDAALLRAMADGLLDDLDGNAEPGWTWFEPVLAYDNGRLPHALFLAGAVLHDVRYIAAAQATLEFLLGSVVEGEIVVPIGQAGWFRRGQPPARYDQQPIDAASLAEVCATAALVVDDPSYARVAYSAWRWFHGANSEGLVVCEPLTGGCHDGLGKANVNHNQGSESTLAYLQAALALTDPLWLGVPAETVPLAAARVPRYAPDVELAPL